MLEAQQLLRKTLLHHNLDEPQVRFVIRVVADARRGDYIRIIIQLPSLGCGPAGRNIFEGVLVGLDREVLPGKLAEPLFEEFPGLDFVEKPEEDNAKGRFFKALAPLGNDMPQDVLRVPVENAKNVREWPVL